MTDADAAGPAVARTEDLTRKTRIMLVRHGLPGGHMVIDPGLSDVGFGQARRLAEWLSREAEQPAAVVSSPYRRAAETADVVAARLELPVRYDKDLREWSSGSPHYVLPEQIGETARGIALAEGRFEGFVPPHDHERLRARMIDAVLRIGRDWPGQTVVTVSHGGAINNLLAHVVGAAALFIVNPGYTSVSQIDVMPSGRLVLVSINETGHLVGERNAILQAAEGVA
jgi:2,3-bisphosphoglycerate-dependent phosphoglycerate mutase